MSPDASASSSASSTSLGRRGGPKQPPGLEDLVKHFVAAKRSLTTHTVLYSANETVNSARELLEENAVLAARNVAVKNIVHEQADALEAVRRGMHVVQAEVQHDFKAILHQLDTAFLGLQSTLAALRDTPIEAVLQPPGTPQKHLYDFIDSTAVTSLQKSLHDCIDRFKEAQLNLDDSSDALDTALENLHSSIEGIPIATQTASTPSPVPSLYFDLETQARDSAQAFQMLVRHYDLCVTALRHTEGGSDAATQATGDAPRTSESGEGFSAPPEPMSEDERQEMLAVLQKDAQEVEDVVEEIRERASEMTLLHSRIENHIAHLRGEDSALSNVLRMVARVAAEVRSHIAVAREFQASWLEDTQPTLVKGIEEWENQRDFYERFDLAYAELLVEVASRRRRHEKAKRKAEEAQKELDRLYAEDERAREQFTLVQGDFLPQDIWPGLRFPPRKYEVRATDAETEAEGEGDTQRSIPQLGRNVVERALTKVKRKM